MGMGTIFGASFGLATMLLSNSLRKLPLLRHPWEHVLWMGLGAVAGNAMADWEEKLRADIEKREDEATEINKKRFKGTVRALPE